MTELTTHPLPLWRRSSTGETAREAAQISERRTLRQRVLDLIEAKPGTPEDVFSRLTAQGVQTVLTSVRPRCSELLRLGLIADSGERARAEGGQRAIVWRATSPEERAAHGASSEPGQ